MLCFQPQPWPWISFFPVFGKLLHAGDRKNFHGAVVVHPTLYDGCVEMAGLRLGHLVLASSGQPLYHNSGKEIVKNHLVEDRGGLTLERLPLRSVSIFFAV